MLEGNLPWEAASELVVTDRYGWLSELDLELARAVSPDGRLPYHSHHAPPGDLLAKGLPSERNKPDAPGSK